jgi:hypothetical protein
LTSLLIAALAAPAAAQAPRPGLYLQAGATNVGGVRHSGPGLRAGATVTTPFRPGGRLSFTAELGYARLSQALEVYTSYGSEYERTRQAITLNRLEFSPLLEVKAGGRLSFACGAVLALLLGGQSGELVEYGVDGAVGRRIYSTPVALYYTAASIAMQARAGYRVTDGLWIDLTCMQGLHDMALRWADSPRAVPQGFYFGFRWSPMK